MESIKNKWTRKFGYTPEDYEILSSYQQGTLNVTDKEEDEILIYFGL